MLKNRKKIKGFTLVEILLVIAIAALIYMIVTRYFESARNAEKVNEAIGIVQSVRAASAEWVAGKPDYTGISMADLSNYGLIPRALGIGVGTGPWGGNIMVEPDSNSHQVRITLTNVQFCTNLLGKFQNQVVTQTCSAQPAGDYQGTFG
jgi:prepilin-type N-terminal cleavage/methylation domain-containing protein